MACPPEQSPERLTLICSKYYGIALAMKRTGYSATLEKIEICVCMSCASLTRTRNPKIDMLKLAGRRPAIEWPHCTAIAKKIVISVLLCVGACHLAGDAKMNMFELIRRRSAMKSSLFSYAIEKKKLYILMFCAWLWCWLRWWLLICTSNR